MKKSYLKRVFSSAALAALALVTALPLSAETRVIKGEGHLHRDRRGDEAASLVVKRQSVKERANTPRPHMPKMPQFGNQLLTQKQLAPISQKSSRAAQRVPLKAGNTTGMLYGNVVYEYSWNTTQEAKYRITSIDLDNDCQMATVGEGPNGDYGAVRYEDNYFTVHANVYGSVILQEYYTKWDARTWTSLG